MRFLPLLVLFLVGCENYQPNQFDAVFHQMLESRSYGSRTRNMQSVAPAAPLNCVFESDRVSWTNRICHYSCGSGDAALTVSASEICPLRL